MLAFTVEVVGALELETLDAKCILQAVECGLIPCLTSFHVHGVYCAEPGRRVTHLLLPLFHISLCFRVEGHEALFGDVSIQAQTSWVTGRAHMCQALLHISDLLLDQLTKLTSLQMSMLTLQVRNEGIDYLLLQLPDNFVGMEVDRTIFFLKR